MKVLLLLVFIPLSGCANFQPEPFPESKPMKDGPGILSGSRGSWTIPIRSLADQKEE